MNEYFYIKIMETDGIGNKTALMFKNYIRVNKINISSINNNDIIDIFNHIKIKNSKIKVPNKEQLRYSEQKAQKIVDICNRKKVKITTIDSEEYFEEFFKIDNPPIVYYTRGRHKTVFETKKIAIIGTRFPTKRGKESSYKIASYFSDRNYVIVSGLANGCDTYGHLGCINNNGKTIAVLPSDVIDVYPKKNRELAEKIILSGGCLISEYPPNDEINDYKFIQRDRLQAALSKVVIVIETDIKGGTMHTVKFTKKYKKTLVCLSVPNKLQSLRQLQGNRKLLEEKNVIEISNMKDLKQLEDFYTVI